MVNSSLQSDAVHATPGIATACSGISEPRRMPPLVGWREISQPAGWGIVERRGFVAVGWRELSPTCRLGDYGKATSRLAVGWSELSPTCRLGDYGKPPAALL
jgi:hypothetical protein